MYLKFSSRSNFINLSLSLYRLISIFHIRPSRQNSMQRQSSKIVTLPRHQHPWEPCTQRNAFHAQAECSGRGAAQSSHGVILQPLAPSSISNLSRSSFHSVYMSLVALMASLCPGPELAGPASATLRHIPGQKENRQSVIGVFPFCC